MKLPSHNLKAAGFWSYCLLGYPLQKLKLKPSLPFVFCAFRRAAAASLAEIAGTVKKKIACWPPPTHALLATSMRQARVALRPDFLRVAAF